MEVPRTEGGKNLPPPQSAGFTLGETIDYNDEAVLKARGLGKAMETISVDSDVRYWLCRTLAPTNGFDEVWVMMEPKGKTVVDIEAEVKCQDEASMKAKMDELKAAMMTKFSDRLKKDGDKLVTVSGHFGNGNFAATMELSYSYLQAPPSNPAPAK